MRPLGAGQVFGVGLVGAGNIAGRYAADIANQPSLRLVGIADLDTAKASALAAVSNVRTYPDLEGLLGDPDVDIVVNLTSHRAHLAVTTAALEANRHVFSEKPIAMDLNGAGGLAALAAARDLKLGSAPIVCLGPMARTVARMVQDDQLGAVRLVYADVNWGRVERWHPAPQSFYNAGPLFDVGIYPITLATGLLGPARRVTAVASRLLPERLTSDGHPFTIGAPDLVVAMVELVSGTIVRLTTNFYVGKPSRQAGLELHGDRGSLWIAEWYEFTTTVEHAPYGEPPRPVALIEPGPVELPWAAGVQELARSIIEERPMRAATAGHAVHVIDILTSAIESAECGAPVDIRSSFEPLRFGDR